MTRIDAEVKLGDKEIWELRGTEMAHPFHIHGASFRILNLDGAPPPAYQAGQKDTVLVNEWAQLLVSFDQLGDAAKPFMFHCHILEHEDAGMMAQYATSLSSDFRSTHKTHKGNTHESAKFQQDLTIIRSDSNLAAPTSQRPGLCDLETSKSHFASIRTISKNSSSDSAGRKFPIELRTTWNNHRQSVFQVSLPHLGWRKSNAIRRRRRTSRVSNGPEKLSSAARQNGLGGRRLKKWWNAMNLLPSGQMECPAALKTH